MARSHGIEFQKMYLLRFTSVARGHHVYKKIWKPVIGETLVCRHDTRAEAKQYDDFAVGIYLNVRLDKSKRQIHLNNKKD